MKIVDEIKETENRISHLGYLDSKKGTILAIASDSTYSVVSLNGETKKKQIKKEKNLREFGINIGEITQKTDSASFSKKKIKIIAFLGIAILSIILLFFYYTIK